MATSTKLANGILIACCAVAATAVAALQYNKKQRSKKCIYLDYNGTTPIYPHVLKAMMPFLTAHYGNASSSHAYGRAPRDAIDTARKQVLELLGYGKDKSNSSLTPLDSIWFTSCGTESDNWAIHVAATCHKKSLRTIPHIITCNVEHPAVERYLKFLEAQRKIEVTYVPVQKDGRVLASDVVAAMKENTILVTIMLANNETGAVQPISDIAPVCRDRGILCHTDAAQAAGKISLALDDLGNPDLVSIVGHKLGAPKGVACLYVRPGCLSDAASQDDSATLLWGGGQEFGRRGGTENVASIVGFGAAASWAQAHLERNQAHMEAMRSRLQAHLVEELGESNVLVHGPTDSKHRLPNTLSVGFRNVHAGVLMPRIGHLVAASTGATCHSSSQVSSILTAMQVPMEFAIGTLRLSLGPTTKAWEIDQAAAVLVRAIRELASEADGKATSS